VTARWILEIAPERDLEITWEPISLLFKNDPAPDSAYYAPVAGTHRLLRVMEAVRAAEGDRAIDELYVEFGRRIHHDRERDFAAADALRAVGLDEAHAGAADDESWDRVIRERMDAGLALVGNDVGTPIMAWHTDDGREVGIFGPVITKVPEAKDAIALWDSVTQLASLPDFWELKRTRTARPEFGERP
jgi:hypothetical protein